MIQRSLRLGAGVVCALLPYALMTACKTEETNDANLDSGGPVVNPADSGAGTDSTPGSDSGPRADGVIRELAFHQLTVQAQHVPAVVPQLSRDGKKIAWSVRQGGSSPNLVFTMDADGSNIKQVDSYVPLCNCNSEVAINDDGTVVASTDGVQTRILDAATGSIKNKIEFTDGVTSQLRLTASGGDLYMLNARDVGTFSRGVLKLSAAGGLPTQVIDATAAAAAAGTTADHIGNFASCNAGLGVSADGSKIVTVARKDAGTVVLTHSGGQTKLLFSPPGDNFIASLNISKDGSLVAYHAGTSTPAGGEYGVVGFDGSNQKVLGEASIGDACSAPVSITDDNKIMNLGHTSMVVNTDGSGDPWPVIAPTGVYTGTGSFYQVGEPDSRNSRVMSMSGDGKRFLYLNNDAALPAHIAIAELDSRTLGTVPTVSSPRVSVASINRDTATVNGKRAAITATGPAKDAFLGSVMFTKGQVENTGISSASYPLLDDGKEPDPTAGDGNFTTGERVFAGPSATVGPRVLRVKAETKAADGKRSGHALDFGPFAVE